MSRLLFEAVVVPIFLRFNRCFVLCLLGIYFSRSQAWIRVIIDMNINMYGYNVTFIAFFLSQHTNE